MKRIVIAVCMAVQLAACTGPMTRATDASYGAAQARLAQVERASRGSAGDGNSATTAVKGVWLGGKSMPFKNDLALPAAFYARKNFLFPKERMSLAVAAERFQSVTGIPVRIASDVYQPVKGAAPAAAAPSLPPLPGAAQASAAAAESDGMPTVLMNDTMTPAAMLEQICNGLGLSWEYKDGVARIERYVTRTLTLKVLPGTSTFSFSSGKNNASTASSGSSAGISTGFSSETTVKSTGTMSPLESVIEAIKIVLTPAGKVSGAAATGSIFVLDTKDAVERAAQIVDRENDILTRNATFHIEVLSFTEDDQEDSGVDVNGLFSNLSKFGATLSAPTSLVSSTAGALGLNVISGHGASAGRFDGTRAVIQLLNQYGKADTIHSVDVRARNRTLTPLAINTQTVYLAQTTPGTASAGGAATTPGLTPGTVTTGFNITLQPDILDSNQIALQFQIGLIDLLDIKTLTSGTGSSQQSIEAPQSGGFEFKQDVFLRPGETMVLSGYERKQSGFSARRLGRDVPLLAGGSFSGTTKKERIFILITPTVLGGAN